MDFSQALRERRVSLRLSQLELALRAGTTQRYLSFLETGRSEPGRDIVIRLAESLELPLRERNDLLVAAGFAPAYPQTSLSGPALAPVRTAIEHVLQAHLPYPAIVVNRSGLLVAANDAFSLITDGAAADLLEPPVNAYRLALHPRGLAPRVANSRSGRGTWWSRCTRRCGAIPTTSCPRSTRSSSSICPPVPRRPGRWASRCRCGCAPATAGNSS